MIPYCVLGVYKPPFWKAWKVGRDLTTFTKLQGFIPLDDPAHGPLDVSWSNKELHAEVRRTTSYGKGGDDWHQDGDTTDCARMDSALVLWSNVTPTQFRLKDGTIFQPEPFEVVVALNRELFHRRPPGAPPLRYLFRQRVEIPGPIAILGGWILRGKKHLDI